MKKVINRLIKEKILILILVGAFVLKVFFLPKWLDDWDSIQLALGLTDYSLPKHQPHPPGYPLYILLGKVFLFIFKNDTTALTMMSAFFGTLTLVPLYLLIRKIFNQSSAFFAAVALTLTPVVWVLSITALTDIVGLFFTTLIGYLFYIFSNNKKATTVTSFFAGVSIGFRFNEFPIMVGLLLWIMLKQRNSKYAFYQVAALILGGLTWLLPMILITGPQEFYDTFTTNGRYVAEHDLLLGGDRSFLGLMKAKILMLVPLFKWGYTTSFTIISILCLMWTLTQPKLWKEKWYQFTLIWLISYCLLLFTFFNLELPRHILPLVIPMVFVTTFTVKTLVTKNKFFWILPLALLALLGQQGYSQVSRFHQATPATIGPVLYVKEHFKPENTVVYASYTLRNFQYYAPEFKSIDSKGDKSIITPEKTVIIDLPNLKEDPRLLGFEEVDTQYFQSDKDIFPKVDTIQLHILKYEQSSSTNKK